MDYKKRIDVALDAIFETYRWTLSKVSYYSWNLLSTPCIKICEVVQKTTDFAKYKIYDDLFSYGIDLSCIFSWKDPYYYEIGIEKNGKLLASAPKELKEDRAFIIKALKNNGKAFEYLPERLKTDKELIEVAVSTTVEAFLLTDTSTRSRKDLFRELIQKCSNIIAYAPEEFIQDREFVEELLKINGKIYPYIVHKYPDKEMLKIALRTYSKAIEYAPYLLKTDMDLIRLSILADVPITEKRFGSNYYIPKAIPDHLSQELSLQIGVTSGSIDVLIDDLKHFIQNWSMTSKPAGLVVKDLNALKVKKSDYLNQLEIFHERLKKKSSFMGTPFATQRKALDQFYAQIEMLLKQISGKIISNPQYVEERFQILRGASVCAGGLLAELTQIEASLNDYGSLSFPAILAKIAGNEVKFRIESLNSARDVHLSNQIQYQLHDYIGGKKIEKDPLGRPQDPLMLSRVFLRTHTAGKLADTILFKLQDEEGLFSKFIQFTEQELFQGETTNPAIEEQLIELEQVFSRNCSEFLEKRERINQSLLKDHLTPERSMIGSALSFITWLIGYEDRTIDERKTLVLAELTKTSYASLLEIALKSKDIELTDEQIRHLLDNREELIQFYRILQTISFDTGIKKDLLLSASFDVITRAYERRKSQRVQGLFAEEFQRKFENGYPNKEQIVFILEKVGILEVIDRD